MKQAFVIKKQAISVLAFLYDYNEFFTQIDLYCNYYDVLIIAMKYFNYFPKYDCF